MNQVSELGQVPQNPMFTAQGQLGNETNIGAALPRYSDTSQYSEAAAVFSTTSPATQSELSDLVNLSQTKKAKLQHRLSDPFRAKLLLDVMAVLLKADSVILEGVLQYLEDQLQSNAVGNDSPVGNLYSNTTAGLPLDNSRFSSQPIYPYGSVGHSSRSSTEISQETFTNTETRQPYACTSIVHQSNYPSPRNMPGSSHATTSRSGNARASLPTPRTIRQPRTQQRSHLPAPLTFPREPSGLSSSHSSSFGPLLHNHVAGDTFRDSTQSATSSSTSPSTTSNHTSTTTVDSNTPDMFNALSQATISSALAPESAIPSQITSLSVAATSINGTQKFICTDVSCNKSFTRKEGRERHERAKHSGEKYTCLRCICTSSCTIPCLMVRHNTPFKDPREDKMKKHLRECHRLSLGRTENPPESWLNRYLQVGTSWVCFECGGFLGTWTENEREINEHSQHCTPWDWWQSVEGLENFLGVENTESDPVVGLNDGLEKSSLEDGRLGVVSHNGQETGAVFENKDEDENEYEDDANPKLW